MKIEIRHITTYRYATPARYAIQSLRLTPPTFDGQDVRTWTIEAPGFESHISYRDGLGNQVHLTTLDTPHDGIVIEASGIIETEDRAGIVRGLPEVTPRRVFLRETPRTAPDKAIRDLAKSVSHGRVPRDPLDCLHSLMRAVGNAVSYEIGTSHTHTTAAEALSEGKGVCQDHAHVFISAARVIGIPARYVNGYFLSGTLAPAEAHHAWAEAWVDGLGWVGFDAANAMCPTERYVRLACGFDAASAAPIRGTQRGGENEDLDVRVEVEQQGAQQQ
ncbi:transglutaminase family protein [Hyphomicrobium sp.]|uniref:transglutaminase family protein n=1 Tax=Hyphomicrobium sp. TaxID=82 RepID=UPI002BA7F82B|nr:transglutaminase family protein [Hyphomicrobium sp.]HRN88878.1 transglutaminase family protein [Hyphomicrobium sp.]HRQ27624.1 transglutaminase family protein [Hyphomicrobium sp.]